MFFVILPCVLRPWIGLSIPRGSLAVCLSFGSPSIRYTCFSLARRTPGRASLHSDQGLRFAHRALAPRFAWSRRGPRRCGGGHAPRYFYRRRAQGPARRSPGLKNWGGVLEALSVARPYCGSLPFVPPSRRAGGFASLRYAPRSPLHPGPASGRLVWSHPAASLGGPGRGKTGRFAARKENFVVDIIIVTCIVLFMC
jgi:hypothetical protein